MDVFLYIMLDGLGVVFFMITVMLYCLVSKKKIVVEYVVGLMTGSITGFVFSVLTVIYFQTHHI